MEKEFVPYQESIELKELGFDEPCFGKYDIYGVFDHKLFYHNHDADTILNCSAPTFSQAFRFFRDNYDLDIDISRNDQEMIDYVERKGEKYLPKYRYGYSNGTFISIGTCMKYEEAELACLRKLIEIVKNK